MRSAGPVIGVLLIVSAAVIPALSADAAEVELPRARVDGGDVAPAGRTIAVPAGGNFQAALDAARPGDVITLEAGATFYGPFTLPRKPSKGWIVIRSSAPDGSLPPPGERVTPDHAVLMPKIVSRGRDPALRTAPGAHHFRLIGLEVKPAEGAFVYTLIELGSYKEPSEVHIPSHIIIDRCYIHGDPIRGGRRGISVQSRFTAVINSHLSDFKELSADTQALWSGIGGPFRIENNYLEAAGENIMFGGTPTGTLDLVPSDIEIRRNHFAKPLAWRDGDPAYSGIRWIVKNLLQFKTGRRAIIEGNVFERNWAGQGQAGWAVVLTPRGEYGAMPWATVEDITFTRNVVRDATNGFLILGGDTTGPSAPASRILVRDNVFYGIGAFPARGASIGAFLQITNGARHVRVEHNTVLHSGNIVTADGTPNSGFVFRDNVVSVNAYGVAGSGKQNGNATILYYFPGALFERNVLAGPWAPRGVALYPANNFYPNSLDDVRFVNRSGGDLRLAGSSPYKSAGTDGKDIGADVEAVIAMTAGVVRKATAEGGRSQ